MSASFAHAEASNTAYVGGSIYVKGSDTILPLAQAEATEFMNENSGESVAVSGGESGVGIAALLDGEINIATSSREITDNEIQYAKKNGINPVATTIAYDGITVVVNPSNSVSKLTFDQLRGIYNGSISNWKNVGGQDKPISVISRDSSSGTYADFKKDVLLGDEYRPDALTEPATGGIVSEVSENPNAIGYIGSAYLDSSTKALSLDNGKGYVYPTSKTILDGTYPLSRSLYMYTNGNPSGLTKNFINFILSDKGQKIVSTVGYVPIVKPKLSPYFSATPTSGIAPLVVTFTDQSTGSPTSWSWKFGDGATSTIKNPTHTYSKAGKYSVSLTVKNSAGSNAVTKSNYISVTTVIKPVAAFTLSPTSGKAPLSVKFIDKSTNNPTSWSWNFGDGSTSTVQNPTHKYIKAGKYTVSLTVKNAAGSNTSTKSSYINVVATPAAAFSASPTSGKVPLTVKFTDKSTGSPTSWSWNFGDKSTSTVQSPSHKYTKKGTYTVSLTVKNAAGSNTISKSKYITVK
jgi:phosphate binding protein